MSPPPVIAGVPVDAGDGEAGVHRPKERAEAYSSPPIGRKPRNEDAYLDRTCGGQKRHHKG
jgi:hypothetical protein